MPARSHKKTNRSKNILLTAGIKLLASFVFVFEQVINVVIEIDTVTTNIINAKTISKINHISTCFFAIPSVIIVMRIVIMTPHVTIEIGKRVAYQMGVPGHTLMLRNIIELIRNKHC